MMTCWSDGIVSKAVQMAASSALIEEGHCVILQENCCVPEMLVQPAPICISESCFLREPSVYTLKCPGKFKSTSVVFSSRKVSKGRERAWLKTNRLRYATLYRSTGWKPIRPDSCASGLLRAKLCNLS